jgi:hypothetical protein
LLYITCLGNSPTTWPRKGTHPGLPEALQYTYPLEARRELSPKMPQPAHACSHTSNTTQIASSHSLLKIVLTYFWLAGPPMLTPMLTALTQQTKKNSCPSIAGHQVLRRAAYLHPSLFSMPMLPAPHAHLCIYTASTTLTLGFRSL